MRNPPSANACALIAITPAWRAVSSMSMFLLSPARSVPRRWLAAPSEAWPSGNSPTETFSVSPLPGFETVSLYTFDSPKRTSSGPEMAITSFGS